MGGGGLAPARLAACATYEMGVASSTASSSRPVNNSGQIKFLAWLCLALSKHLLLNKKSTLSHGQLASLTLSQVVCKVTRMHVNLHGVTFFLQFFEEGQGGNTELTSPCCTNDSSEPQSWAGCGAAGVGYGAVVLISAAPVSALDICQLVPSIHIFWGKEQQPHMVRYGPCIFKNWMTSEGPPATISGGIWLRGQFSIDMICRLVHRASSKGRLCSIGFSLRYRVSRDSSVPISSGR